MRSQVVATDVNRRALWMTRLNAALNGVSVEVRDGSFFEPVAGEKFDLIATNPPFVISPATGERLVYRDSGLPGDRVVEDIVRAAPTHLTERGLCQILANWSIMRGTAWDERLASWLTDDCDALVIQREVIDPSEYVEMWLKDEGVHGTPDYPHRYDTWLSWFDDQGIEGVGFGWINLQAGGTGRHRLEEWRYDVEQPIGPAIADHFAATRSDVDLNVPPRGEGGRDAGDAGPARGRGPGHDRGPPAARLPSGPPGRHGRGGADRGQRRRPVGRTDPRRRRRAHRRRRRAAARRPTCRSCASWSTRASSPSSPAARPPRCRCG